MKSCLRNGGEVMVPVFRRKGGVTENKYHQCGSNVVDFHLSCLIYLLDFYHLERMPSVLYVLVNGSFDIFIFTP